MAFEYINRCGEVYFLQAQQRKRTTTFSATRRPKGATLDGVPEGYEIYERPDDGQVFVRKIRPTSILPLELQLVEAGVRRLAGLEFFLVVADGENIVVYLTDAAPDAALVIMESFGRMSAKQAEEMRRRMLAQARYSKMMRFTLMNEKRRRFSADRWCFLGSIDNWFSLAYDKPLAELVEEYVPHLGKESFFELM